MRGCILLMGPSLSLRSRAFSLRIPLLGLMTPFFYLNRALFSLMRRSLGIISGAFALKNRAIALKLGVVLAAKLGSKTKRVGIAGKRELVFLITAASAGQLTLAAWFGRAFPRSRICLPPSALVRVGR